MQSPPGLHMITLLLVSFCWKLKLHNTYKCWCSNLHVFPSRPGHLASTPKRVLSMPTSAFNTRNIMYSAYYGRTLALQGAHFQRHKLRSCISHAAEDFVGSGLSDPRTSGASFIPSIRASA